MTQPPSPFTPARPSAASTPSFEQGPIRPPSEAYSLLVRVIRNCVWNRCTFCPVYKGSRASTRPLEDVLADVDALAAAAGVLRRRGDAAMREGLVPPEAYQVALFVRGVGMSGVGIPSVSAAYASVSKEKLPAATTALNIAQRLGGPKGTAPRRRSARRRADLRPSLSARRSPP